MLDVNVEVRVQSPLLGQQPFAKVIWNSDDGERKTDELCIAFCARRSLGGVEKRALDADADSFVARPVEQIPLSRDVLLEREAGRKFSYSCLGSAILRQKRIIARVNPGQTARRSGRSFVRRNRNDFSALRAPPDLALCHNPLQTFRLTYM